MRIKFHLFVLTLLLSSIQLMNAQSLFDLNQSTIKVTGMAQNRFFFSGEFLRSQASLNLPLNNWFSIEPYLGYGLQQSFRVTSRDSLGRVQSARSVGEKVSTLFYGMNIYTHPLRGIIKRKNFPIDIYGYLQMGGSQIVFQRPNYVPVGGGWEIGGFCGVQLRPFSRLGIHIETGKLASKTEFYSQNRFGLNYRLGPK